MERNRGTVALVTCAALPGLAPDDRVLLSELTAREIRAEPAVWEDPYTRWEDYGVAVIRSTWDYAFRRDRFVEWAQAVSSRTHLLNSAELIRWNTHKAYLLDIAGHGVPTVPTILLRRGEPTDLARLLEEAGWSRAIVKGAVAQTGRHLKLVDRADVASGQRHVDALIPHEDLLLQPYLPAVTETGETSLVFVSGELTHAVVKEPAPGDFRVHDDHGGTVSLATPTEAEIEVSQKALQTTRQPTLYGRVDLVRGPEEEPLVMELELVEPELFLRFSREATVRLADEIEDLIR